MKFKVVLCTSSSSQLRKRRPKAGALCVFRQQGAIKICRALHLLRAFLSALVHSMLHALPLRRCHVVHGVACAAMPMSHVARACIYIFKCVRRVCHFPPCGCSTVQWRGNIPMPLTPHARGELRTYMGIGNRRMMIPLPTGGVESLSTPDGPEVSVCTVILVLSSLLPSPSLSPC